MIQRIQTVYLALAAILTGVFLVLPLFSQSLLKEVVNIKTFSATDDVPLLVAGIVLVLTIVGSIFSFGNRAMQIKLIWAAIVINIVLAGLLAYWYSQLNADLVGKLSINFGAAIPVVTIILNFLAATAVKKDDKLVKSLDRLR